jgi:hypothetical protein
MGSVLYIDRQRDNTELHQVFLLDLDLHILLLGGRHLVHHQLTQTVLEQDSQLSSCFP